LIGERADMILAPLTINPERAEFIGPLNDLPQIFVPDIGYNEIHINL